MGNPKMPKVQFSIKTCSADNPEALEGLLNQMSFDGWDLYSMHEGEADGEFNFNCIFIKEFSEPEDTGDLDDIYNYKTKVERLIKTEDEPYELFVNLQRKIKDKRQKISQIKSLIDSTSENQRQSLNNEISKNISELNILKKTLKEIISPDNFTEYISVDKLKIRLSEELLDIANPDVDSNLISQTVKTRQKLTEDFGYIIPNVRIDEDETLLANEFSIDVRGVSAIKGLVYPGYVMFFAHELQFSKAPKNSIKDIDIITSLPVIWIEESQTKDFWCAGLNASQVMTRVLEYICVSFVDDILDYNDINRYVDIVAKENVFLIENVIPEFISVAEIKYILTNLIKEKVSIKDIIFIFEKINDYAENADKNELLAKIRTSLSRQITKSLSDDENGLIQLFELKEETVKYFTQKLNSNNAQEKISSSKIKKLLTEIEKTYSDLGFMDKEVVILAPYKLRQVLYCILSTQIINLRVIAQEELTSEASIEVLGEL